MTTDMSKMVIAISNWAPEGSLDWLQHGACSGSCDKDNTFSTLSNLKFVTNSDNPVPPQPEPEPTDYTVGSDCENLNDEDCANVENC